MRKLGPERRWYSIREDVRGVLEALAEDRTRSPRGIALDVLDMPEFKRGKDEPAMPSEKTLAEYVTWWRKHNDPGAPWTLGDTASAADGALVVPLLPALVAYTAGGRLGFTRREAERATAIRQAAPDLPAWWVVHLTFKYLSRLSAAHPTASLDLLLGCGPWRSSEAFGAFVGMARALGWLDTLASGRAEGALMDACRMEAERRGVPLDTVLQELTEGAPERTSVDSDSDSGKGGQ